MSMSLGKQKKVFMVVAVVGVIMLVAGFTGAVSSRSWYSNEIPEYKEWGEVETVGQGSGTFHVNASTGLYLDVPWEFYDKGDVIKLHISNVDSGTIDVTVETLYPNETIYTEDDVSSTYFNITLQKDYLFVKVALHNTNFFADKDVTMSISHDAEITKDNQEEIDNATWEVKEKRDNVSAPLCILGFIGFFVMLAGIGGWGDAVWKSRKRKRVFPTQPTPPSARPLQPPAQPTPPSAVPLQPPAPAPKPAVALKCPHCGANVQPSWKACPACAEKLKG